MEFVHQPSPSNRLGDYLKVSLRQPWTHFRAAVAFVKRSGTQHIAAPLAKFAKTCDVEIIVGIDHGGSSSEGLWDLLYAVSPKGRVIVFHNSLPFTFHPKIYLFKSSITAEVIIGSGNLTQGGLFTNYEAALRFPLDLTKPDQAAFVRSIEDVLDSWADTSSGTAHKLDEQLLARLTKLGFTPSESSADLGFKDAKRKDSKGTGAQRRRFPFVARAEHRAPAVPTLDAPTEQFIDDSDQLGLPPPPAPKSSDLSNAAVFVMTLQQTDVGVGQTSKGTSRRSPEIFIPLGARNANPDFWNWPDGFVQDPKKAGKLDRPGVRMRLHGNVITVNMMTWPDKHDFRLRSEQLRSAGDVGDILRLKRVSSEIGYEYEVDVVRKGASHYPAPPQPL